MPDKRKPTEYTINLHGYEMKYDFAQTYAVARHNGQEVKRIETKGTSLQELIQWAKRNKPGQDKPKPATSKARE